MAELKTRPTDDDVEPVMWGSSIVGFGSVHYRYASGREGDWFSVGFSPRKKSLTVYLSDGVDRHAEQLQRLGTHSTGKGCLYTKRLAEVDREVPAELIGSVGEAAD